MTQEAIHKFIEEITTELDSVHAAILAKHPHDEAGVPAIENQDLANAVGAIERARVGLTELAYALWRCSDRCNRWAIRLFIRHWHVQISDGVWRRRRAKTNGRQC